MEEPTALGMPLLIDNGGQPVSPLSTLVVVKGMDSQGDIVRAVALSDGMDIFDALELVHFAKIDIEQRVSKAIAEA